MVLWGIGEEYEVMCVQTEGGGCLGLLWFLQRLRLVASFSDWTLLCLVPSNQLQLSLHFPLRDRESTDSVSAVHTQMKLSVCFI